jgi:hypothetical protein
MSGKAQPGRTMGRTRLERLVGLIYAVSVLIIAGAVAFGIVILNTGLPGDEAPGPVTLILAPEASERRAPVQGETVSAPDAANTVWVSTCPEGTMVVSGSCNSGDGAIPLQRVGPNPAQNSWECVWAGNMPKANARALCLKQEPKRN